MASDVYLAGLEIVICGVVAGVACNLLLLYLIRYFIRSLYMATVLLLLATLSLVDLLACAKAGLIEVPQLTAPVVGDFGGVAVGPVSLILPAAAQTTAAQLAASPIFVRAADAATAHWLAVAGAVSVAIVCLVLGFVRLASRATMALEICREATKAVVDNRALLSLPLGSTLASVAIIGYLSAVTLHILTPDPESIATQIGVVSQQLAAQSAELADKVADAVADATRDAIAQANDLAEEGGYQGSLIAQRARGPDAGASAFNFTSAMTPSAVAAGAIGFQLATCVWLLAFVDALVYATIAGTVAYWYTERADGRGVGAALCRLVRYHIGSLALGSAMLTAASAPRALLVCLRGRSQAAEPQTSATSSRRAPDEPRRAPDEPQTSATRSYVAKCSTCCIGSAEHGLRSLTRFSLVHVATEGAPFFVAAARTSELLSAHPLQMLTNGAALAVLSLLLSCLPPLGCALLAYCAVTWQWRSPLVHLADSQALQRAAEYAADALASVELGGLGPRAGAAVAQAILAIDGLMDRTAGALPDWSTAGPPDALTVALATLAISGVLTLKFRRVYAATVDTLFVCMFREDALPAK